MAERPKIEFSFSGFLPITLGWVLLASIGWCGDSCQSCTNSGIKELRSSITGE